MVQLGPAYWTPNQKITRDPLRGKSGTLARCPRRDNLFHQQALMTQLRAKLRCVAIRSQKIPTRHIHKKTQGGSGWVFNAYTLSTRSQLSNEWKFFVWDNPEKAIFSRYLSLLLFRSLQPAYNAIFSLIEQLCQPFTHSSIIILSLLPSL